MTYTNTLFDRNIGVWSETFQDSLRQVCVAVAGVGGAAHAAIDILVRNGIGRVKLADPDTFAIHNLQRQILATQRDIGRNKAEVVRDYIHSVNPKVVVDIYPEGLSETNVDDFLQGAQYVIEALDISVLHYKRLLHAKARQQCIVSLTAPIIGCGAGLLVFYPHGVSFEEYFDFTQHGGFAVDRLTSRIPEYFQPNFFERMKQGTVPTTCDGAYLTGVLTAGVIKRLLAGKPVKGAPFLHHLDVFEESLYPRSLFDLGETPLHPWKPGVYLKLEGHHPTGSAKYRVAQHILEQAWHRGLLKPDQTILEISSGNMGVAIAMFAKKWGLSAEIYSTPEITPTLHQRIQDYGGQVHIVHDSPMKLPALLQHRVTQEGCFWPNQYMNPEVIHSYQPLCRELQTQIHQEQHTHLDYFVAALGTGGSLMGVGPFLRETFGCQIVCVESDLLDPIPGIRNSEHQHLGPHDLFHKDVPDHTIQITHQEALHYTAPLQKQGILATTSTGACLAALHKLSQPNTTALILSADGKCIAPPTRTQERTQERTQGEPQP